MILGITGDSEWAVRVSTFGRGLLSKKGFIWTIVEQDLEGVGYDWVIGVTEV